ncbi:MAG: DUF72 domain-containing protein [Saprospiraceae bacterium]
MDFGKLPSVDQVDFRLPPEPVQNAGVLATFQKPTHPTIYVGPTGYNMKPWVGKWYPPGAREQDFLRHYGAQFNTIEFNTTHYRIPDEAMVGRWRDAVPDDFRFCPKIPQSISHARDLGLSGSEMAVFCKAINGLETKLGCCFIQLPPHFIPRELNLLARFLEYFSTKIPLAVEVRHPSFFQKTPEGDSSFHLLQKYQTAAVITDVAGRRDVCHMRLTSARTLIRFVGNGLHPSDYTRIEEWAAQLKIWLENGLQEVYFFAHEPDNLLAPELTAFCVETFKKVLPGVILRGPKQVDGQQGVLF